MLRNPSGAVLVLVLTAATARAQPDPSSCCGKDRASLGSFFANLELGQTSKPTLPPTADLGDHIDIELQLTGKRVDGLVMTISDTVRRPPLCPVLRDKLTKAWGAPTDDRWSSGARAVQFATLSPPSCALRFYRLVPPTHWLNTTRQSVVPVWAIGKPKAKLVAALAALEPGPEEASPVTLDHSIEWEDLSIDGERITLKAFVRNDRVTGIRVELFNDTGLRAWQRVKAVYGAPATSTGHEDHRRWTWRRGPGIEVINDVGTLPHARAAKQPKYTRHPDAHTLTYMLFGSKH